MIIEKIETDKKYLSEVMTKLPSKVLLNKGVTGCGGTFVELHSLRNSLILVPTIELARNKWEKGYLIVWSKTTDKDIINYIDSKIKYKKIIGTYDSLKRILDLRSEITNYFLLIDEYHILFNSYALRDKAILFLLKNYDKFQDYCFMTATPLSDKIILNEIQHLNRINIEWKNSVPIKLNLIDSRYTSKELSLILDLEEDCNYHIFLNSVRTIREFVLKYNLTDYKVVCSQTAANRNRVLNIESTKTLPKKYNFYTASAFEGCDIYDEKGKTIIICDTTISTTILDISTLIRQICGRLRDSIYKDQITLILNTSKHRYAGVSEEMFNLKVQENINLGKYVENKFKNDLDKEYKHKELRSYTKEAYHSFYVNRQDDEIFFDDNLRKMDEHNFKLIQEIYNTSISVLKEAENHNMEVCINKQKLDWIINLLNKNKEYSYSELEEIFSEEFKNRNLVFDGRCFKYYFPSFTKKVKQKNKIRSMYYKFDI